MKGLTEGGREHPIMFRVLSHIRIDIRDNTFNGIAVLFYEKALFRLSFCGKSSNVNGIDSLVRFLSSVHLRRETEFLHCKYSSTFVVRFRRNESSYFSKHSLVATVWKDNTNRLLSEKPLGSS